MKRPVIHSLFFLTALALVACQRTPKLQVGGVQKQASEALKRYSAQVSNAHKARMAMSQSSTGRAATYSDFSEFGFSGWNPFGGTPYSYEGSSAYMHADIEQDIRRCVALVRAIPRRAENYQFAIATLSQCVNQTAAYRNPMFTTGYNGLDQYGQSYWRYGLDAARPGYFGQYPGWYGIYDGYASQGFNLNDLSW